MTSTGTTRTTPTGSFHHAAIASTRIFDPTAALDPDRTIHGLGLEAGYIWGTLRDDDGTRFYRFPEIADAEQYKDRFRAALDAWPVSTTEADGVEPAHYPPPP